MASIAGGQLTGVGLYRFNETGKKMPAIPMIIFGTLASVYNIRKAIEWLN